MTFKKKQPAEATQLPEGVKPESTDHSEWKYEDGVDVNTPPEIRERWLKEYCERKWAGMAKADFNPPLFQTK